ncbi:MAG: crossover junction endodeoxyribonuclease RuvC [Elusimicrobia bacterium]|nr:crossover junction endodeoxyribonuclease RuvC [Elusimicrobiota bacterium]MBU2615074.1 crossover junction endodeoxyribonuclease RuvC [Elusimicrobiota bacterium]
MIVLGIDPGLARCGWAVIEQKPNKENSIVGFGCIETPAKMDLPQRLSILYSSLENIIKKYKPQIASLEKQYLFQNAKSVLATSQARGVILLAMSSSNLEIREYNPKQVKISVTGYGAADKQQIQRMVKIILKLKEIPKPDDIADAMAVGLCHLNSFDSRLQTLGVK